MINERQQNALDGMTNSTQITWVRVMNWKHTHVNLATNFVNRVMAIEINEWCIHIDQHFETAYMMSSLPASLTLR